ncbi:hypothetical protein B0H17DRAFT_1337632 [Mycena rosella]|uniref:Uncharacterized protein n=1 Tax=Mycena rosella TaxID=1033263 RepID=A0AAD7CR35_MYCRO|nr:hypothetical protein B0H17DRAFT_1337632 [Mycena rosella]
MGFDPNRQDVALELGDPLWELSAELDGPSHTFESLPSVMTDSKLKKPRTVNFLKSQCTRNPDVARELGFPPLRISTELDGPFAYTQELDVCDDRSKIQNIPDSNLPEELADGESGAYAQGVGAFPRAIHDATRISMDLLPLPLIPVASPPPRPPNPIAAHLDRIPTSGSSKRKFRDDDPADDINIHARRPRKMPKRADL